MDMAEKVKDDLAQGSGINSAGGLGVADPADINTIIVADGDVNSKNQDGNQKNISSDYGGTSVESEDEDDNDNQMHSNQDRDALQSRVSHMGAAIEAGHLLVVYLCTDYWIKKGV